MTDRRAFLLGGLGAAVGGFGALRPGHALAAPTPQGDDIAHVQLGVVGKLVALACADRIGRPGLLRPAERRLMGSIRAADARHLNALLPLLGEDAPSAEDFSFVFPRHALRDADRALQLMGTVERLVIRALLGGVAAATDPGTRVLLGGIAAADATHLTGLLAAQDRPTVEDRLPTPLTIERASERLDRYLRTPGFDSLRRA